MQPQASYESEISRVNFGSDAESISQDVNTWVQGKTNGLIKELVTPDSFTADTLLVLLNAVYFKGKF